MKHYRNEHGLVVVESAAGMQWLGPGAEYLSDFGRSFVSSNPPTLAELATAVAARHERNAPAPVAPPTKAERIKRTFEDRPEMLALVKTIAALTGQTREQVVTALVNNLV